MIAFGRGFSKLTSILTAKTLPLSASLRYCFACKSLLTQPRLFLFLSSLTPSIRELLPSSWRRKDSGSSSMRPWPISKPIKLQSKSRVPQQESSPSSTLRQETTSESENPFLTSTPMRLNQLAHPHPPLPPQPRLLSHKRLLKLLKRPQRLRKHPRRALRRAPNRPHLLRHPLHLSPQEKERKLANLCRDLDRE